MTTWLSKSAILSIHVIQIEEHGGLDGLRDEGLLESALQRPRNLDAYGEPGLAGLAASYAWGIARNHPFLDGNKRTSLTVCLTFLALNGYGLRATDNEKIETWLALAAGSLEKKSWRPGSVIGWLRPMTDLIASSTRILWYLLLRKGDFSQTQMSQALSA